jgi:hypothetical protein
MSGYLKNSLSPSEAEKVIEQFDPAGAVTSPFLESFESKSPTVSERVQDVYENGLNGMDTVDGFFDTEATPVTQPPTNAAPAWTFITAPEDVSWDIANNAQRIDIFGTNNPPVVAGSRGMRDLTLSNSLVEGFVRNVQVEGKVAALESLMDYGLNSSDGFVSVPVYQVWANEKSYGGPEAYYIIKDVKVKETMRDLTGYATRAYVDISLMQVPAFQVNSGRDQASAVTSGAKSGLISEAQTRSVQQAEAAKTTAGAAAKNTAGTAAASAKGNQGVGVTQPKSGPGVGADKPKVKPERALPGVPLRYNRPPR